eukprot:13085886-Ditylum_brightwellii.AAC.1
MGPNRLCTKLVYPLKLSIYSFMSAGVVAFSLVDLISAAVVCVASSTASTVKLEFTTSSSIMGPTAYSDRPVGAVAAIGMGCPPAHLRYLIIFRSCCVTGMSTSV